MKTVTLNTQKVLRQALRYWPFIVAILVTSLASLPANETALAQYSDVGFRDFRFGSDCISAPSGEKPESKLWWHDGTWWGNLCHSDGNFHIYRLNMSNQTWEDTGVVVDDRKSDALMDPTTNKLYIVTHVFTTSSASASCPSQCGRLYRFTYNPSTRIFTKDNGFPVTVTSGKAETVVLTKDSTGQLWVTYVENRRVMVNRSLGDDLQWGTPFQVPASATAGSVSSDDISSIVAWQGKIGVLWSNQNTDKFYFAIHDDNAADTTWQAEEIAAQGNNISDDHISLQTDTSGRVFAAVKTSTDPLNLMLVRQTNGSWSTHVFGTDADNHTRPILVVDSVNGRVHYFATAGQSGGAIYYKSTSTSNPSFPPGQGDIFISHSSSSRINNATSMKANVSPTTGIVVVATDGSYYYHNYLPLDGSEPPTVTATTTTTTVTVTPTTTTPTTEPPPTTPPGPTMTFNPTDDAMVRSTSPNSNYGSLTTLRLRSTSSETINSYLKFNLTGISSPVLGARLRLFVTDASPSGGTIFGVSDNSWTESTIRWSNAPAITGPALGSVGNAPAGTWVEYDVSSAITGNGVYSFGLANGDDNSALFASSEASSNQPELVVYVDQDGTITPTTPPPTTVTTTATTTVTATTPAPTTPPPGEQLTFGATDDSQVKSASPTRNYGSLSTLRTFSGADTINSYLKFTVTGTGGSVNQAILRLYVTDPSPDGGSVYLVSNNLAGSGTPWTESNIIWDNAPPFSGSPLDSAGNVALNTWVELDVTAAINGDGTYSFALASNDDNSAMYSSSEAGANQPQLVIVTGLSGGPTLPTETETTTVTPTETETSPSTPTETLTPTVTQTPPVSETSADQVMIVASDDAQVKSSNPSRNYGSLDSLRTRATSSENINSYLKFNVTGLAGAPARAVIRLYVTDASPDSGSIYLVSNNLLDNSAPWTEGTITWSNAPAYSGAPVATGVEAVQGSWVYLDVTSAITGDGVYSFALVGNNSNSALYNSKEAGENVPALILDVGPGGQTQALQMFSMPVSEAVAPESAVPQMLRAASDNSEQVLNVIDEGQIIESDSELVARTSGWVANSNPSGASGASYLVNTGPDDSLTLNFSGTRIAVGYVANQAFGPFAIEIDGQPVQVVSGSGQPEFQFDQRAVVEGLTNGLHTLRIVPMNGMVAIDYFVTYVPPAPVVVAQVVTPPAQTEQLVETEVDPLPPSETPTELATKLLPVPETAVVTETTSDPVTPPQVIEPPTATPPPAPVPLPVYATSPESFEVVGAWRLSEDGLRWHADGTDSSVLTLRFPLDLRGAQQPVVQFQSWLVANNSSAALQVSLDGLIWNTFIVAPAEIWQALTIDLSAFREQVIWLRWVWITQPPAANDAIADTWEMQQISVIDLPPATEVTPTATFEVPVLPPVDITVTPEVTVVPELPTLESTPLPTEAPTVPPAQPTQAPAEVLPPPEILTLEPPPQEDPGNGQGPASLPEQASEHAADNALGSAETTDEAPTG